MTMSKSEEIRQLMFELKADINQKTSLLEQGIFITKDKQSGDMIRRILFLIGLDGTEPSHTFGFQLILSDYSRGYISNKQAVKKLIELPSNLPKMVEVPFRK